jgi:hypothetical protein
MKKRMLLGITILLLAAGCNSSQQATNQPPVQTPVVQNTNSVQVPTPTPTSAPRPTPTPPPTATPSPKTPVNVINRTSPTPSAIPLSQAIKNYSDNNSYNFSDGSGSNVDVVGTIKNLVPIQSGVTEAFGNTIIITDGIYTANIHNISDVDFQNLTVGEKVEIRGGYMQSPSNNNAPIIRVDSVKIYQ